MLCGIAECFVLLDDDTKLDRTLWHLREEKAPQVVAVWSLSSEQIKERNYDESSMHKEKPLVPNKIMARIVEPVKLRGIRDALKDVKDAECGLV